MKPTRIAGQHYDKLQAIGEPEDRSVPYILDKVLDYLLNGEPLPQYIANRINVPRPALGATTPQQDATPRGKMFPWESDETRKQDAALLKEVEAPQRPLPGTGPELQAAVDALIKPADSGPKPPAPAEPEPDVSGGDNDQLPLWAVVVEMTGQVTTAGLTREQAQAIADSDPEGSLEIRKAPAAKAKTLKVKQPKRSKVK